MAERKNLLVEACGKFFAGVLMVGLVIFLSAGTLRYRNGWLFMALLFVPMFLAGLVMLNRAPDLLKSRLDSREALGEQKTVVALSGLMFLTGFLVSGLDYRFGWSRLPGWISLLAGVIFLVSYLMYGEVLRENVYLSRTIQVQEGQRVVDTGLYGIVRHPMYLATLFLFLTMPLILGSFYGFLIFLVYPFLLVRRIRSEEKLLTEELPGYEAYRQKVKYRLLPFLW